jgi:hypothetical protein
MIKLSKQIGELTLRVEASTVAEAVDLLSGSIQELRELGKSEDEKLKEKLDLLREKLGARPVETATTTASTPALADALTCKHGKRRLYQSPEGEKVYYCALPRNATGRCETVRVK